ncbi:hypothetical protein IG631_09441 [Alternaria alternata]|nr:hypothetical protein IG631_09441 [Alternaria alternata]
MRWEGRSTSTYHRQIYERICGQRRRTIYHSRVGSWKPVRVDVWEVITAFRAPQRLNKPTGEWHSKPVSGAATFLRLEPEDSPALNAYSDRGLKSYAN